MVDEKEKTKKVPKAFFEETIACAWCGKSNKVRGVKEVTVPAVPAQRTIEVFVEKETQTKLDDHPEE